MAETGLTLEQLQDLADRMKTARFGVMFFGMGLSMTRGKHMNSAALLTLAAELNAFTKFVAMPMRGHGNVTGGDVIMRWTTGYPFGVNLCRGYPRFNPGEFSTVDLLVRGDADAALILGADPGATMPQPAIDHLAPHPDDRARPQGDAHEPAGPRPHHDGGHRHQRAGDGVPDGRDPAAAAAGAEIAVSDRRRGYPPHLPGGGREAAAGHPGAAGVGGGVVVRLPGVRDPVVPMGGAFPVKTYRIPPQIVLYKEGDRHIAHCLQLDLIGDGKTVKEAIDSLGRAILTQIEAVTKYGDMADLFSPADGKYFEMFASGKDIAIGEVSFSPHEPRMIFEDIRAREYEDAGADLVAV